MESEHSSDSGSPPPKNTKGGNERGGGECGGRRSGAKEARGEGVEEKRKIPPQKRRKSQGGGEIPTPATQDEEEKKEKAAEEVRKKQEKREKAAEEARKKQEDEDRKRKIWSEGLVKRTIADMKVNTHNTGISGWALARSNASAGCRGCGMEIQAHGFRLRYRRPEGRRCAGQAVGMSDNFDRYYHIKAECLECEQAPFVEKREQLGIDVKPLPPRMEESTETRNAQTEAALTLAMKEAIEARRRIQRATATAATATAATVTVSNYNGGDGDGDGI